MNKIYEVEKSNYELIEDLIEGKGHKLTYQRSEILKQFLKNKQKHLTAEDIYYILKEKGIGISTVYRAIKLFVELDIVKEFKIEDTGYYELKMYARKPLHMHFKCDNCGAIEDITDQKVILEHIKMNKLIEKIYKNEIYDADIILHGLCQKCKEQ
ncbi:Fur family transcriptional regulator [Clostridiisalibacter paucivorans]|uniref:Fur family transcriptional regulator n=1 Tax=Clostridiisalibacter paucivorans TaxID=408753 RepID=UPI000556C0DD|nr:Fur family transcriptional regulator [Clostridiisalibacter paucivorans]